MTQWKPFREGQVVDKDVEGAIALLATNRGIPPDETAAFYSASLSSLSNPSVLGDGVEEAARILTSDQVGTVSVIGDYDADGILSSAIIDMAVRRLGGTCSTFIPSRWTEGYGLNDRTVDAYMRSLGGKLPDALFVLDCGSSSEGHVRALKGMGIKRVVVIDHHIIDKDNETVSADAHVNWRSFGSASGYCAAGETFQVARRAFEMQGVDWKWLLPFAAIATVGDVVPVSGDNRAIVRNGIDAQMIMSSGSVGLWSIIMRRCRGVVSQKSIAFYVVPRINAAGRMGDPKRAFDFVVEEDQSEAMRLMAVVEAVNDDRKALQDSIFRQGVEMLGGKDSDPSFVFLHDPQWNIGVCGISCSQMVDKFGVPAMMFGTYDGKIRGSGRSIPGVDIKAVLDGCGGKEVFERYGGHEMACGATVRGGMFGEAQRRFGKSLAKQCGGKRFVHQNRYDADLAPRMVVKELGDALMKTLYPYCAASNPEPVFRIHRASVKSVFREDFKAMSKVAFEVEKDGVAVGIPMSAFAKEGVDDVALSLREGDVADFYVSFPQEEAYDGGFGGGEYQLELVDVERSGP